jgi:hypothetical protein
VTRQKRLWWSTALAGMAGFTLAVTPVVLASDTGSPAAEPGGPDHACRSLTPSTKQLAMIDSAGDDSFQCLGLSLEGQTVTGFRLETHGTASAGQHSDLQSLTVTEFPKAVMESKRGAVLDGRPGHDAIVLRGHLPSAPGNMELVMSYLYNGVTGEYRSCQLTLRWAADTGWRLTNNFDQMVTHINIVTRSIPVVGLIGIARLEGACPAHE